jgi:tRNA (guanine-N7-)-methyltransferase
VVTDEGDSRRQAPLRSFGRRRGRKLSPLQQMLMTDLLPRLTVPVRPGERGMAQALFDGAVREIWLEIGFGGAEHLMWQAQANPEVGVIGAEPYEEGVVKALAGVAAGNLSNVLIHADDARLLLDWLPDGSVYRVFVLFPDPWPKKRHAKRRLVSPAMLAKLARVMRQGGELRLATDIATYAGDMLLAVRREGSFALRASAPSDWRQRPADWPETRYERKALLEQRRAYYFRLLRS